MFGSCPLYGRPRPPHARVISVFLLFQEMRLSLLEENNKVSVNWQHRKKNGFDLCSLNLGVNEITLCIAATKSIKAYEHSTRESSSGRFRMHDDMQTSDRRKLASQSLSQPSLLTNSLLSRSGASIFTKIETQEIKRGRMISHFMSTRVLCH